MLMVEVSRVRCNILSYYNKKAAELQISTIVIIIVDERASALNLIKNITHGHFQHILFFVGLHCFVISLCAPAHFISCYHNHMEIIVLGSKGGSDIERTVIS